MNCSEALKIPMPEILSSLGHSIHRVRKEHEFWYYSPFRKERTPSFKINTTRNCWADFGVGGLYHKSGKIGGSVIDFAKHYEQTDCTKVALDFLRKLNFTKAKISEFEKPGHDFTGKESNTELLKIIMVKRLENRLLLEYLSSRKINLDIARMYLQEIYYQVNFEKKPDIRQRPFFAVGMQNDSKCWEVRNEFFKGILGGKKNVTTYKHTEDARLSIFEGMMDFLSLLTFQKRRFLSGTSIILHSTAMVQKVILYAKQYNYKKIVTYLDNDRAGEWAYEELEKVLPGYSLIRGNSIYKECKDLNEWLVNLRTQK